ncbi:hypothetical protein BCR33DRAFT_682887 [Rhizoclosmatium globosum]|uniref:Uncharacterized protein n=1 Tax=Rhizoclosmatium globosum TaxID=329046 RepID=A0A1Y2BT64_9FUNG|nr:hypothetical protein BCR33DRAFT_682887 [Rhizoclosmatium globosum]|eukprot:ORY37827.1 hypothetical protein BCR33DRAFT_682887 [Rhizoclosmatium globosum]
MVKRVERDRSPRGGSSSSSRYPPPAAHYPGFVPPPYPYAYYPYAPPYGYPPMTSGKPGKDGEITPPVFTPPPSIMIPENQHLSQVLSVGHLLCHQVFQLTTLHPLYTTAVSHHQDVMIDTVEVQVVDAKGVEAQETGTEMIVVVVVEVVVHLVDTVVEVESVLGSC